MAFEDPKEKQRVMWGAGPFERVEPNLGDMHAAEDGICQDRLYLIAHGTRR